jgi:hypothetical protein
MNFRNFPILFIASVALASMMSGCGTTYPNRNIVGEPFPAVRGRALSGEEIALPEHFKGKKVIIVVGYVQETQFDVDRWGIGFFTANLPLPPVYEVPTIPGLLPSLFKGAIDKGMRSGIPEESWKDVVTVYGSDGGKIAQWTGTQTPRNCRVILLDENGIVLWMHDKGYGLPPLTSLLNVLKNKAPR